MGSQLARTATSNVKEHEMRNVSVTMRHASAACLSVALLAVAPAVALAQTTAPEAPQPQTRSPDIPDQKLDAAAAAMQKVGDLKRDYQQQLNKAQPADQERITKEANQAMSKAVTDQGLSVDEYNGIMQIAQNDLQVREKILQRMKAK